jgi:hypothetical protein
MERRLLQKCKTLEEEAELRERVIAKQGEEIQELKAYIQELHDDNDQLESGVEELLAILTIRWGLTRTENSCRTVLN